MKHQQALIILLLAATTIVNSTNAQTTESAAKQDQLPIIDMHFHAQTNMASGSAKDPWYGLEPPANGEVFFDEIYKRFRRFNIVKAVGCGTVEDLDAWKTKDEDDRIIRGLFLLHLKDWKDLNPVLFENLVKTGKIEVFGELKPLAYGSTLCDPEWQPYLKICERNDIPVSFHAGRAGPGESKIYPETRCQLGDPYLIEEVLIKYPKLRIYAHHIGMEFHEHTLVLLLCYEQFYTDLSVTLWVPTVRRYAREFLANVKEAGCLNKVMFGTDVLAWPEAIEMSIEYLNSFDFLSEKEKRNIFYNNAARFLKLKEQN